MKLPTVINYRVVSEYFMLNLKKENMLQFGDIPPNSQYDDILVSIVHMACPKLADLST